MTYEDLFVFFYPVLYILGTLLSMIPAYIAFKRNKNFWVWWLGTTSVFVILLFAFIQTQAISKIIYLLAIDGARRFLEVAGDGECITYQIMEGGKDC